MIGNWVVIGAAVGAALVGCSDAFEPASSANIQLAPGFRLISGPPLVDTALAQPSQPFVVEVRDSLGGFKSATPVTVGSGSAGPDSPFPSLVSVLGSPNDIGGLFDILPLDTLGRVKFWVKFGAKAGGAQVTVSAFGRSGQIKLTILPGHAAKIRVQPSDTVLYVGRSYRVEAVATDRSGNDRPDEVRFGASPGLSVSNAGLVTTTAIGRRFVQLRSGSVTDTAWVSVPPLGTLAAISGPAYRESIVVLNLDGSDWRALSELSTYSQRTAPQWAPSGQELVFHNSTNEGIKAYRVDLAGNVRRALSADAPPSQNYPRFSRDGQWLFFSGANGILRTTTWRARADGSAPVQLGPSVFEPYFHTDPSPSPDGNRVVYEEQRLAAGAIRPVIRVLNVVTRDITPLDLLGVSARWAPNADRIAYVNDAGQVVLVNPDGFNPRIISGVHKYGAGMDWSPDGAWIVVRSAERPLVALIRVDTGETLPLPLSRLIEEPAWRSGSR